MARYKLQIRKNSETQFADATDWLSCSVCLKKMLAVMPSGGDLQVIDEQRHVIASTVRTAPEMESRLAASLDGT